ncbi:Tyrosine--tRNA ligase [subsurface metagenome]
MSKSLGNYIGVDEPHQEIFGKVMSIPDNIMMDYFRFVTTLNSKEIREIEYNIKKEKLNPSIAKRKLAKIIIENLYTKNDALEAEEDFDLIFKKKGIPDKVEEYIINLKSIKNKKISLVQLLTDSGLTKSNSEARRLVAQGGIKINDRKINDPNLELNLNDINEKVIQRGKRHFRKIITKN